MNPIQRTSGVLAIALLACAFAAPALAQETSNRKELRRLDLPEMPTMEIVTSVSEFKTGETFSRHYHHGTEVGYVLQGSMIQEAGKEPRMFATGTPIQNLRDVPHAGFTVVGETTLRLFTVHIVDKGKPLYDVPK